MPNGEGGENPWEKHKNNGSYEKNVNKEFL